MFQVMSSHNIISIFMCQYSENQSVLSGLLSNKHIPKNKHVIASNKFFFINKCCRNVNHIDFKNIVSFYSFLTINGENCLNNQTLTIELSTNDTIFLIKFSKKLCIINETIVGLHWPSFFKSFSYLKNKCSSFCKFDS